MRKINIIALLFFTFISFNLFAQSTWKHDPNHSKLGFTVTHMTIADVTGFFDKFEATVTSSQADFSDAVIELKADIKSINTGIVPRDNHLRSADFFDAENHPDMIFKSTSIEKTGENTYLLKGNLSFHGVTREISVNLIHRGTVQNQNKQDIAGLQITGTLNRLDYNIGPDFPEFAISNEVRIKADGEFIRQ